MKEIFLAFSDLLKYNLTPNGLFVLHTIYHNTPCDYPSLNRELEIRHLKREGYLTQDGQISDRGIEMELFTESEEQKQIETDFDTFVKEYLLCWEEVPAVLPSKQYARGNKKDIAKNLKAFMKLYKFSQQEILDGTKKYLEKQCEVGYQYCRTAQYFILKNGKSDLATEIEHLGKDDTQGYIGVGMELR